MSTESYVTFLKYTSSIFFTLFICSWICNWIYKGSVCECFCFYRFVLMFVSTFVFLQCFIQLCSCSGGPALPILMAAHLHPCASHFHGGYCLLPNTFPGGHFVQLDAQTKGTSSRGGNDNHCLSWFRYQLFNQSAQVVWWCWFRAHKTLSNTLVCLPMSLINIYECFCLVFGKESGEWKCIEAWLKVVCMWNMQYGYIWNLKILSSRNSTPNCVSLQINIPYLNVYNVTSLHV